MLAVHISSLWKHKVQEGEAAFIAPLKQKETVILFNTFLLEATPLPPTSTVNSTVLRAVERAFIMAHLFLLQSTLYAGRFLESSAAHEPRAALWTLRVNQAHKRKVLGGESRQRESTVWLFQAEQAAFH